MLDFFKTINWKKHILALSAVGVSVVLLALSIYQFLDTHSILENTQRNHSNQQSLNREAFNNKETFESYISPYNDYKKRSIIGSTQRLQWIEILQALAIEYYIPNVQFTLESTTIEEETTSPYWHQDINIQVTPMHLEMRLIHEGDLFRLMSGYLQKAQGMFSIDTCEINRKEADKDINYTDSEIKAICDIHWYTLGDITKNWDKEKEGVE